MFIKVTYFLMRSGGLDVLGVSSKVYMKRLGLPGGNSERGYEPLKWILIEGPSEHMSQAGRWTF